MIENGNHRPNLYMDVPNNRMPSQSKDPENRDLVPGGNPFKMTTNHKPSKYAHIPASIDEDRPKRFNGTEDHLQCPPGSNCLRNRQFRIICELFDDSEKHQSIPKPATNCSLQ